MRQMIHILKKMIYLWIIYLHHSNDVANGRFRVLPAKQLASRSFNSNWFQLGNWTILLRKTKMKKKFKYKTGQYFFQLNSAGTTFLLTFTCNNISIILILYQKDVSNFFQRCTARSLTLTTTWRSKCSSSSSSTSTRPSSTSPSSRASSSATPATTTTSWEAIWEMKT